MPLKKMLASSPTCAQCSAELSLFVLCMNTVTSVLASAASHVSNTGEYVPYTEQAQVPISAAALLGSHTAYHLLSPVCRPAGPTRHYTGRGQAMHLFVVGVHLNVLVWDDIRAIRAQILNRLALSDPVDACERSAAVRGCGKLVLCQIHTHALARCMQLVRRQSQHDHTNAELRCACFASLN
jgi:hypothetical protein